MSSWLNFNESLSNLKGQISSFANNVLAEDTEGPEIAQNSYGELKQLCIQQEVEIRNLKQLVGETGVSNNIKHHAPNSENNWDWNPDETSNVDRKSDEISALKTQLKELEAEKNDLVIQLEQLDSDSQQNIAKLVGIRDRLQNENYELKEKCVSLKQHNKSLVVSEENAKKKLSVLQDKLEETQQNIPSSTNKSEEKYEELLQENHDLKTKLEDAQKELSVLKSSNDTLQKVLEDSRGANEKELLEANEKVKRLEGENKILYTELQKANSSIKQFELKSLEDDENCQKLAFILESYEKQVSSLKTELESSKTIDVKTAIVEPDLRLEMENLKKDYEAVLTEKENLHTKYVNILTDNVREYVDCDKPSDFQTCSSEDPHILEFSKQVENILKILLDFKCKCEALEKEVYEISQEKTNILEEKNNEIEKLIQNSEILSQEVIRKTETVKDLENECNELIKNNDLLISELDSFRNNSSLQTISESNEDNMLLLETQLENANKRIDDLEKIIDDFDAQKEVNKNSENTEEETLNKTKCEDEVKNTDYQELLNSFDNLHVEYDALKNELDNTKEELHLANKESEQTKTTTEKLKTDFENTEYQLTEANINIDGLQEELEGCVNKIANLLHDNKELRELMNEADKNNEYIRSELNEIKEKFITAEDSRKQLEIQVKTMTEKLQNAKMTETSLKLQYDTLQKELVAVSEAKNNIEVLLSKTNETIDTFEHNCADQEIKYKEVLEKNKVLKDAIIEKNEAINSLEEQLKSMEERLQKQKKDADSQTEEPENNAEMVDVEPNKEFQELNFKLTVVLQEKQNLQEELEKQKLQIAHQSEQAIHLHQQLQDLTASRNELINIVTTKHHESMTYHNEIQRLSQILNAETEKCRQFEEQLKQMGSKEEIQRKNDEIEKLTDQNEFLKEKCDVLANNLVEEQAKVERLLVQQSEPSEKEQALAKKLERLQTHLIDIEEHYTQELLQAERKNAELQTKVNDIEQREKNSSTMYTSVSIRANQQVEILQNQLQMVTNQRDELRKKMSDAEDLSNKQSAALANLQFVLEQFQKDKQKDVLKETERIRRQINAEKQKQDELRNEISNLKSQLQDSKQGLQAASRLSDQLELSKKQNQVLKEEVSQLQEKLTKHEETLKALTSQTDGKIEKSLIKSLIIGFISSNNNMNKDQMQILKIIATVLDFSQQDHDKVKSNHPAHRSWLSSFLKPQAADQNMSYESLSQAFVKFLENESKPRVVPSLLTASNEPSKSSENSKRNTPRQSPIVLSEIVLPTFTDFAQNRNSSSILKDVLKDNS